MKYFIIAGEASGDIYGYSIIQSIINQDPQAQFAGIGGDKMNSFEAHSFTSNTAFSVMGYKDVLKNLGKLNNLFKSTKIKIKRFQPDAIIFIDYPGFNLRMAKWAKKNKFRTIFFICPKIWAWKKYRYKSIKSSVDQLISILPFEEKFLENLGIKSQYFGHPLAQKIEAFKRSQNVEKKDQIAILPGSRKQELKAILPIVNQMVKYNNNTKYIISKVKHIPLNFYEKYLDKNDHYSLSESDSYNILLESSLAVVTSGTATLECALLGTPQVVVYKTDLLSYSIAKRLVQLDYISLPNLILDRGIVRELIQDECTKDNILDELKKLKNKVHLDQVEKDYKKLNNILFDKDAMDKIATAIVAPLQTKANK